MELDLRKRLELVLSAPTAPFAEGLVHARLRAAVAASPRLSERLDEWGNLEVTYGPGRPRLLFTCHTDHPGLVIEAPGRASIRGGIRVDELVGHDVTTLDGSVRATVSGVARRKTTPLLRLKGARGLKRGTPLVLDMPALTITKRHTRARAIDDLCAAAACLTAADRLAKARWKGTVGFLFTRAEEVGFAGALGWVRSTRFPKSTTIVNLEMSTALPHVRSGDGPVLRVGDRISTFAPDVTLGLQSVAAGLARRHDDFKSQRALMDGGACEATVFMQAGFRAGALCLPLRNTHNHAPRGGMAQEYVDNNDLENLVRWMVAYTRSFGKGDPRADVVRRLERLWRRHKGQLKRSAGEGSGA
ncbi:MAG: M28 family peptidase [Planctomycetota bacterium]|jgi:endoglucanase